MTKRPDIVIRFVKAKKFSFFELTVPFEENFDWAHQRKLEKYENQREQCVGCRGFTVNLTSVFLTNLGLLPPDKRKYMEKIRL